MPINPERVEQIVEAAPNFRNRWERFLEDWQTEEKIPYYVGFSELAHYVVESYSQGSTVEFPQLFGAVENLLQNSDPDLENLIGVGFFEDIQNISSHRDFGAAPFRGWLGPRSLVLWEQIDLAVQRVAAWTPRDKPRWWQFWRRRSHFNAQQALEQVENLELRKIMEANYRKLR